MPPLRFYLLQNVANGLDASIDHGSQPSQPSPIGARGQMSDWVSVSWLKVIFFKGITPLSYIGWLWL